MILRAIALLLALLFAPAAAAQSVETAIGKAAGVPPRITGLTDAQVCLSLGRSEDLSDIDRASCRSVEYLNDVDTQNRVVWITGRFRIAEGYPGPAPLGFYTGALASRDIWWNGEKIGSVSEDDSQYRSRAAGNAGRAPAAD